MLDVIAGWERWCELIDSGVIRPGRSPRHLLTTEGLFAAGRERSFVRVADGPVAGRDADVGGVDEGGVDSAVVISWSASRGIFE